MILDGPEESIKNPKIALVPVDTVTDVDDDKSNFRLVASLPHPLLLWNPKLVEMLD